MSSIPNPFGSRGTLTVDGQDAVIYRLPELEKQGLGRLDRLPFSIRILLENALRFAGHGIVTEQHVRDIMAWKAVDRVAGARSRSCRRGWCCRTSPACPAWWTWRRCATPSCA